MKIKLQFVSNSSSSSFIIGLDHIPTDVLDLHKQIWGDEFIKLRYYDNYITSKSAANSVFQQLQNQKPLTDNNVLEVLRNGYFLPYHEMPSLNNEKSNEIAKEFEREYKTTVWIYDGHDAGALKLKKQYMDQYTKEQQEYNKETLKLAQQYWDKHKNKFNIAYKLEYHDDTDFGSAMEHGGFFDGIPNICISNH